MSELSQMDSPSIGPFAIVSNLALHGEASEFFIPTQLLWIISLLTNQK